jgi:hypothetical protein
MYDLVKIDLMYLENVRQFVEEAKRHANSQNKNNIFYLCVDCENKIVWPDSKVVQSHLIKRGFKRNYTIWIKYGEIDDTLHEVDTEVGDNNFDGLMVYLMEMIMTLLMETAMTPLMEMIMALLMETVMTLLMETIMTHKFSMYSIQKLGNT